MVFVRYGGSQAPDTVLMCKRPRYVDENLPDGRTTKATNYSHVVVVVDCQKQETCGRRGSLSGGGGVPGKTLSYGVF
jgi:hypothetical protein